MQTFPNHFQNFQNLYKPIQTIPNVSLPIQTYPNWKLSEHIKTYQNIYTFENGDNSGEEEKIDRFKL